MSEENIKVGGLYILASSLMFTAMGALIKYVSANVSNEMIVFFRSTIGFLVLLPWFMHRGLESFRTKRVGLHVFRAVIGFAAMYCFFYALGYLNLADAVLLNFSTPLFVPFIALLMLGEAMSSRLWLAILTGFIGIVLILKPGAGVISPAAVIGLASGILAAFAMVLVKRLTWTEPTTRIVFYFTLVSVVLSAIPLPWRWVTPPTNLWLPLLAIGFFASLGQMLLTRAYHFAAASHIGPLTYATVVFAAFVGWFFWDEIPDRFSLLGALLISFGSILAIRLGVRPVNVASEVRPDP